MCVIDGRNYCRVSKNYETEHFWTTIYIRYSLQNQLLKPDKRVQMWISICGDNNFLFHQEWIQKTSQVASERVKPAIPLLMTNSNFLILSWSTWKSHHLISIRSCYGCHNLSRLNICQDSVGPRQVTPEKRGVNWKRKELKLLIFNVPRGLASNDGGYQWKLHHLT